MVKTQVQFPDPLYRRLKEIADQQDWSLAEVMRKAAEHFVGRFPPPARPGATWKFPTIDCGGDFKTDPAKTSAEADAIAKRS